ncbi:twin-arginine translocase subunit TatB [Sphingomonas asaccharolytica]|uniref:twin-arginine translocase subunit TatB n=1 Tax=Sphingomonas asaccharolytica TaxID=40681 RepID=UPI001FE12FA2|nr:twin-arginine translocase subunit TatB [Sphingomonas asaccharolytica]
MLDIAPTELLVLGAVALLVIPPKDLPRAMRFAGQWVGKARGLARQFRSGFDDMIREAEFAEMEKKWKAENERIMREFPQTVDMAALMAPKSQDVADADPTPMMVEQPTIAPEPEPIHAAPETDPAPAARKPRVKTAKKAMSLDTFEPAAPKPRARKPKTAAPVETPGD